MSGRFGLIGCDGRRRQGDSAPGKDIHHGGHGAAETVMAVVLRHTSGKAMAEIDVIAARAGTGIRMRT